MDDVLFLSYENYSRTKHLIRFLHGLFEDFGLTVSVEKSVLSPVTEIEFLGFIVSVNGTLCLTPKRYHKVLSLATKLLKQ